MSFADSTDSIIGINWGSSNFRAYLIAADGTLLDERSEAAGVVGLDRPAMAARVDALADCWPDARLRYASGMIGSNVGWTEVAYAEAPAGQAELALHTVAAAIGRSAVNIVPGIACNRSFDGSPDVLRGEEIELMGLVAAGVVDGLVALPGTHTKWAWLRNGRVTDFFTAMSGEIYDRLTKQGLLASIVSGGAYIGPAFDAGVEEGLASHVSLATSLFGVRARVVRGALEKADAASFLRGLLIGSEIADARRVFGCLGDGALPIVGNGSLSQLYIRALSLVDVASQAHDSKTACLAGFRALHEACHG